MNLSARLDRSDGNTPWGFRMHGGSDYRAPLSIQRVTPGSLAAKCGLQVGDVILKIGDTPTSGMAHKAAQQKIVSSGNSLVLNLQRGGASQAYFSPSSNDSQPASYNNAPQPFGGAPANQQYNSPLKMYSTHNVDSLSGQTANLNVSGGAGDDLPSLPKVPPPLSEPNLPSVTSNQGTDSKVHVHGFTSVKPNQAPKPAFLKSTVGIKKGPTPFKPSGASSSSLTEQSVAPTKMDGPDRDILSEKPVLPSEPSSLPEKPVDNDANRAFVKTLLDQHRKPQQELYTSSAKPFSSTDSQITPSYLQRDPSNPVIVQESRKKIIIPSAPKRITDENSNEDVSKDAVSAVFAAVAKDDSLDGSSAHRYPKATEKAGFSSVTVNRDLSDSESWKNTDPEDLRKEILGLASRPKQANVLQKPLDGAPRASPGGFSPAAPKPAPVAAAPPPVAAPPAPRPGTWAPSVPTGPRKMKLGRAGEAKSMPAAGGGRIPVCNTCHVQIRGPFISAVEKTWCPAHFVCANPHCQRELIGIGFVEEAGQLYCELDYERYLAPRCGKCGNAIIGQIVSALNSKFHPQCFLCCHCRQPIQEGRFHVQDGEPYCEKDWAQMFQTKCYGCQFPIEPGDRWVEALNENWHSECFNCSTCQCNLEGQPFFAKQGKPYCKKHASTPRF